MRTDELHKFSDGTLNHVRTTLNDIATRIQMDYLPKRQWSPQDKRRARVMISDIDRKLKDRRLMRNLEKFVGGRPIVMEYPKRPAMFLNLWRYKVVRHRYSNPMIQPEPEGSTQGYPLVSVEVLRFYTSAGNPVKEILLKLNLPDHRILKDGGEDFRYSDTERLSRSDEVLKLKNFKKDATLKLSKSTNQECWNQGSRRKTSHSQLVDKKFNSFSAKCFSEDVRQLILRIDKVKLYYSVLNLLFYEVESDVNMF
ncbi:hypothetical protein Tco_0676938 [Tanacetum coccineum]